LIKDRFLSPRKAILSLYISTGIKEQAAALKKLGKHKTGVGCLYINKLEDIDMKVLKKMIDAFSKDKFYPKKLYSGK